MAKEEKISKILKALSHPDRLKIVLDYITMNAMCQIVKKNADPAINRFPTFKNYQRSRHCHQEKKR